MPMSMLSVTTRTLLSMSHARMVVINASSSFLIDVPRSTLLDLRTKHLSMLHRKVAITNVSGFFLTVVLTGCISMYVRESERLSCYIASTCECSNSFIHQDNRHTPDRAASFRFTAEMIQSYSTSCSRLRSTIAR